MPVTPHKKLSTTIRSYLYSTWTSQKQTVLTQATHHKQQKHGLSLQSVLAQATHLTEPMKTQPITAIRKKLQLWCLFIIPKESPGFVVTLTWDSVKAGLWTVDWTMDWITGIWTQFQTHFSYGSKPGQGGGTTIHSVNAFPTGGFD